MTRNGRTCISPKKSDSVISLPDVIKLMSYQDIKGETRLAVTTHESADVGVCLRNYLECRGNLPLSTCIDSDVAGSGQQSRTVDLDVDIGADAVDYKSVFYLNISEILIRCAVR